MPTNKAQGVKCPHGTWDWNCHICCPQKFCKDCKWIHAGWSAQECRNPRFKMSETDYLVNGVKPRFYSCFVQRMSIGDCGPEGKFWEGKENG